MYDRSGSGRKIRHRMGLSLAWWHNYKWVTKRTLITFGLDFIGPMFHFIFPTKAYNAMKISHTSGSTLLSYIRLSYPSFRQLLRDSLANPVLVERQRVLLQNLQHLCEFFIPLVLILYI